MQENDKEKFSINKNIFKVLDYYKVNRYKFSQISGISQATLLNLSKCKNKPSIDFIEQLLKTYPSVNANWLITSEGEMLKSEHPASELIAEPITEPDSTLKTEIEKLTERNKHMEEIIEARDNEIKLLKQIIEMKDDKLSAYETKTSSQSKSA